MATADDDPVPRLPRGRGLTLSWPQIFRIGMTLAVLILVIAMQQQCSHAVGKFVTSFDGSGSGSGRAIGKPGTLDGPAAGSDHPILHTTAYVQLPAGMSDAEMRALIDRVRAQGPQLQPPTPPPPSPAPPPAQGQLPTPPFDAMTP